jgi:hypothetical protein
MSWGRYDFAPYVPVAQKLGKAAKLAAQRAKKEQRDVSPVKLQGKAIAKTFWGKAWCDNLTAYQDFSNRLPRGATYVRNGSVVDLVIHPKNIAAIVAGSEPYTVKIEITELDAKRWKSIRSECSESIDSLLDLLSGKLSDGVMKRLTDQKTGLFPSPGSRDVRSRRTTGQHARTAVPAARCRSSGAGVTGHRRRQSGSRTFCRR